MKLLDGKTIAQTIFENIKKQVMERQIKPGLAVILIGSDPASEMYVNTKELRARDVGFHFEKHVFPSTIDEASVTTTIHKLNTRPDIHGIIIQLPIPEKLYERHIYNLVDPKKDVDGFHPASLFKAPIALGVWHLLETIPADLAHLKYVVVGKGITGGGPIIRLLRAKHIEPIIIDSSTKNPHAIMREADVLISTVGKPGLIQADAIKPDAIVIDTGIVRLSDGMLAGDVDARAAEQKAEWYTPVPGGVGPMTVAYLLSNTLIVALRKN